MNVKQFLIRWLNAAFTFAAIAIPAASALSRVAVDSAWRDDLATVRGLGLVSIAGPASISCGLMQFASLFPMGPLTFRMGVVSAFALAACAGLIQSIAKRILDAHVKDSPFNPSIASMAALTASLGPALQREATVAGGATISLAAALAFLDFHTAREQGDSRILIFGSLALGAVLAESPIAALAVLIAVASTVAFSSHPLKKKDLAIHGGIALALAAVLALPVFLRSSPDAWFDLGRAFVPKGLLSLDTAARPTTALAAWKSEVGTISLATAGLGIAIGIFRKRTRTMVLPLLVLIVIDIIFPASSGAVLTLDSLMPLRMLAVAAVAICAGLGVQIATTTLIDTALPMARAAAVLLIAFNLTLVTVTAEQAAYSIDRSASRSTEAYTDEALQPLETGALVFVRSHAMMWRLLASRVIDGSRPDIIIVPFPLVNHGRVATDLLSAEPSAAMMLRDLSIDGTPGEHAMTYIADRRALYVEMDPAWDAKVSGHLIPDGLWLRLHPQPIGNVDRKLAVVASERPFVKINSVIHSQPEGDTATRTVLISAARQQALAAAQLGDRKSAFSLLERIATLDPNDLFARDLTQRLEHSKGKVIDTRGLLR